MQVGLLGNVMIYCLLTFPMLLLFGPVLRDNFPTLAEANVESGEKNSIKYFTQAVFVDTKFYIHAYSNRLQSNHSK